MNTTVKQQSPSSGSPSDPVRSRKPSGFVDLLPGPARFRRDLEQAMLTTFEQWGYDLVETPAVEELSTLERGVQPELLRRLFKFSDSDGRLLAMVGERTVPVARVAAGQLRRAPRPLRICYLGATFQGHPAPGTSRESFQAGAELIGARSAAADAEVVAMAIEALEGCGLEGFQVEVGHVGFFRGVMDRLAPGDRARVVDALAGRDLVELEKVLAATDLGTAEQALMLRFPALRGDAGILDAAAQLVDNPTSAEAVTDLGEVYRLLQVHGVADRVSLDLGAVRDFQYYTGAIFEVFAPTWGAPLAAGGRYDGLLQRFGEAEPATGLVVFLDRVHGILGNPEGGTTATARTLVGFDADSAPAVALASRLRAGGEQVAMDMEPSTEAVLRERAADVGAGRVLFCDAEGAWDLDAAGRTAMPPAPGPPDRA